MNCVDMFQSVPLYNDNNNWHVCSTCFEDWYILVRSNIQLSGRALVH